MNIITDYANPSGPYFSPSSLEPCSTIQSTSACTSSDQNSGKDELDANPAIASSPFTKQVPAHLEVSNQEISNQCGDLLAGWDDLQGPSQTPIPVKALDSNNSACWEVMPTRDWFEVSLGRRAAVGHDLLEVAQQNVSAPSINISTVLCPERPDLWESPFTMGFLSVGFRRFRPSMQGSEGLRVSGKVPAAMVFHLGEEKEVGWDEIVYGPRGRGGVGKV